MRAFVALLLALALSGAACAAAPPPAGDAAAAADAAFPSAADRALLTWFAAGGGALHQVVYSEVEQDDGDAPSQPPRRGLFAKAALADGAVVATLGAAQPLTLRASALPYKRRLTTLARRRPACALALALLWELSIGDRSAWAPYVATLPLSLPAAALARSAGARAALNGTFAAEYLARFWGNEATCFDAADAVLFATSPATFPRAVFRPAAVAWALATVRQRAAPLQCADAASDAHDDDDDDDDDAAEAADDVAQLALLPVADLLPHAAASCGGGATLQRRRGGVRVRSCATADGQEAALPRGALPDAALLARFGALPPGANAAAALALRLPPLQPADEPDDVAAARRGALQRCGGGGDADDGTEAAAADTQRVVTADGASPQLLCAVRAAQADAPLLLHAPPLDFSRPVSAASEAEALAALVLTCEALLADYPASPGADREALADAPRSGACAAGAAGEAACAREARAAALREKTLLAAARDAVEGRLKALWADGGASQSFQVDGPPLPKPPPPPPPPPVLKWDRRAGGPAPRIEL